MTGRIVKTRTERRNKQRRKRYKKNRKLNQSLQSFHSVKGSLPSNNNSPVNWKAVNMAANYWSQSRSSMMEWQYKHEIAYWKSKCQALSYENNILHGMIQNIYCNIPGTSQSNTNNSQFRKPTKKQNVIREEDEEEMDDENIEISEEFMSYLKKSMEHKMELEKTKKDDSEMCEPPKQAVEADRQKEMKMLYGKASPLIVGLETKVNLNYDMYKDKNKPDYWPYFPLNPTL